MKRIAAALAMIEAMEALNEDRFAQIVRESIWALGIEPEQVADRLRVSRSTIGRWSRGKNIPHERMRAPILKWFRQELLKRLEET